MDHFQNKDKSYELRLQVFDDLKDPKRSIYLKRKGFLLLKLQKRGPFYRLKPGYRESLLEHLYHTQ